MTGFEIHLHRQRRPTTSRFEMKDTWCFHTGQSGVTWLTADFGRAYCFSKKEETDFLKNKTKTKTEEVVQSQHALPNENRGHSEAKRRDVSFPHRF